MTKRLTVTVCGTVLLIAAVVVVAVAVRNRQQPARNQAPPKGLTEALIAMFRSGKHPPVVLDYCIQHLGAMQCEITDDALRRRIREIFVFAARQTRQPYAGTALYSLAEDKHTSHWWGPVCQIEKTLCR